VGVLNNFNNKKNKKEVGKINSLLLCYNFIS